jgi:pilus assembly protein CpaB
MRMKSLILIFIALGCGLVASIGISQVMDKGGGGGNVEMEQILVALVDIDIGAKLDAQNVKLEDWPKNKVPEGAVRRLDDVKEKFANSRFFKGEPIHVNRITDNVQSVAGRVPEGYRAMPVKVDEDTVMKAISPGDRVDVNVFLRKSEEIPQTGVFTILKNVRVFAVNTNTERSVDSGSKSETANFRTISLLVKPDQSRDLAVAAQVGKILLTLRRPDQDDVEDGGEDLTPIGDLLSGTAKLGSPSVRPSSGSASRPKPPANRKGSAEFAMELWTPNEVQSYEWHDRDQMPYKSGTIVPDGSVEPQPLLMPDVPSPSEEPDKDDGASNGASRRPGVMARTAGSRR